MKYPGSVCRRFCFFAIELTSIWDRIFLILFLFYSAPLKYLIQQLVHMATATRTLELSKIHKISTNK